jgi:hypothetical protein
LIQVVRQGDVLLFTLDVAGVAAVTPGVNGGVFATRFLLLGGALRSDAAVAAAAAAAAVKPRMSCRGMFAMRHRPDLPSDAPTQII